MKNEKEYAYKEIAYFGDFGIFVLDSLLLKNKNIVESANDTDSIITDIIANNTETIYKQYEQDIFSLFKNEKIDKDYMQLYENSYCLKDFHSNLVRYCFLYVCETISLLLDR